MFEYNEAAADDYFILCQQVPIMISFKWVKFGIKKRFRSGKGKQLTKLKTNGRRALS